MKRIARTLAVLVISGAAAFDVHAQLVAERITKENASQRLFSGSDVNGGIGDWYLSNGVVEAIIDDAAFSPDLLQRGIPLPVQSILAPTGGTLIDLALVGKHNDQLTQVFQVANLTPSNAFFYTGVTAAVTAQRATLTAVGVLLFEGISTTTQPTLAVQTVYSVGPGEPFITMTSTVLNRGTNPAPVFNITDAIPLSARSLLPFVPFPGRGFNNPVLELTPQGIGAAIGVYPFVALPGNVGPADGMMDTVTGAACGEVSYGLVGRTFAFDPDGPAGPTGPIVQQVQALLGVNSGLVSASGNPFDPARSPALPAGGSVTYTRVIAVGDRNDVASVSNLLYAAAFTGPNGEKGYGILAGDVDGTDTADVEASLQFEGKLTPFFGEAPVPLTQTRTDKQGRFGVALPAGEYTLKVISPGRDDVSGVKVTVTPAGALAPIPPLSPTGRVAFTVTENGSPVPAKLTFVGVDGTRTPDFSRHFDAFSFDPETHQPLHDLQPGTYTRSPALNHVFSATGAGSQSVKPGKYQVIASRGLEYSIASKVVTVEAGKEVTADLALTRVVDTKGYVSADFHVHSGRSFDSSTPLTDRVTSYAAEGVETLVSTDHNYIIDLAPVVQKLGLSKFVRTIVGNELTTSLPNPVYPQGFGHHNMFPLLVEPQAPRRGAVNTEYVNAATFYDRMSLNNPGVEKVVSLNHPRAGISGLTDIGLFGTLDFDPTKPLPSRLLEVSLLGTGTRNIDFDAMEIANGASVGEYQRVRNDWFSLIGQGYFKTGTAVSDSHRIVVEAAGFPRSYVASPTDEPAEVKDADVVGSVKAANVIGTSGPFLRFEVEGSPIGSLVSKRSGTVALSISVTAPAWVPVDEVRLLANGRVVQIFDGATFPTVRPAPPDPTSTEGVNRFRGVVRLNPPVDTYYVVEAGVRLPAAVDTDGDGVLDTGDTTGDGVIDGKDHGLVQPPSPPLYAAIAPGFVPLAFTNPIFVDRNDNGRFEAPGIDPKLVPRGRPRSGEEPRAKASTGDYYPFFDLCVDSAEIAALRARLGDVAKAYLPR